MLNKNQIHGTAKDIVGQVQSGVGDLVGSKEMKVKGLKKQIEGSVEKGLGDIKERVKNAKLDMKIDSKSSVGKH